MSEDLAWAAGFFDGEGCTTWHSQGTKNCIRIGVVLGLAQVVREPLDRFQAIVQAGTVHGPYSKGHPNQRPQYHWKVQGVEPCLSILSRLWPWLSEFKKDQAIRVLVKYYRQPPSVPFAWRGRGRVAWEAAGMPA